MRIVDFRISKSNENIENWMFVEILTDTGLRGLGEISSSPTVADMVAGSCFNVLSRMIGLTTSCDFKRIANDLIKVTGIVKSTVISGISQALLDIAAKAENLPLYKYLGGKRREIKLYANINRAIRRDRENATLFSHINDAKNHGFSKIKIAPFDSLNPEMDITQVKNEISKAIYRIDKAIQIMGKGNVAVDCHRRCSDQSAKIFLDEIINNSIEVDYVEDLLDYSENSFRLLNCLKERYNIKFAGGEYCTSTKEIDAVANNNCFSYLNPDIKFIGTIDDYLTEYLKLINSGIVVMPHNPTSPISTAFSAAIISAMNDDTLLEFPFGTQNIRDEIINEKELLDNSVYYLSDNNGIGVTLSKKYQEKYCFVYNTEGWVRVQ